MPFLHQLDRIPDIASVVPRDLSPLLLIRRIVLRVDVLDRVKPVGDVHSVEGPYSSCSGQWERVTDVHL